VGVGVGVGVWVWVWVCGWVCGCECAYVCGGVGGCWGDAELRWHVLGVLWMMCVCVAHLPSCVSVALFS